MDLQTIWGGIYPQLANYSEFQKNEIKAILFSQLGKFTFEEKKPSCELTTFDNDTKGYNMFFIAKRVEGLSEGTLRYYKGVIDALLCRIPKSISQISTDDVRYFLAVREIRDKVSKTTIDNERRIYNAFFGWLADEDYISKNIVKPIKKIRTPKIKKKAFSETDIAKIKDACLKFDKPLEQARAIALVEVLLSTGCRIAEISNLKKSDIDIEHKKALVFGKGAKERIVYLNDVAKMRLLEYWNIREDDNKYAFCSVVKPYSKLCVSGLEIVVKNIGELAAVTKCHPHRFRRTTATRALKRGMPIIDIQRMLGHENIDTTRIYLDLDDTDLKYQHEKFL